MPDQTRSSALTMFKKHSMCSGFLIIIIIILLIIIIMMMILFENFNLVKSLQVEVNTRSVVY